MHVNRNRARLVHFTRTRNQVARKGPKRALSSGAPSNRSAPRSLGDQEHGSELTQALEVGAAILLDLLFHGFKVG
jgi:hypothetical protein